MFEERILNYFLAGLCLSSLACLLTSCDDSSFVPPPIQLPYACHVQKEWDEALTGQSLLGKWEWEYKKCICREPCGGYTLDSMLTIEFRADDSLLVRQNDVLLQASSWEIIQWTGDLFAIEAEPFVEYLVGSILFCENRVVFSASSFDLCDHYFVKVE